MSGREILNKYVHLEKSCLLDSEKKQVMDISFKYKDTFSLRDEIGTCQNIDVETDVTDKSPFFIRPYHVKEEGKIYWTRIWRDDGILKEDFSWYSSPVMLISRKVTKDKTVVSDFRCLNVRIAKNNLVCLLLKDTFSVLGSSRCQVL